MAVRKQDFDDHKDQAERAAKRSRITFDVTPELRDRIKIAALKNGFSISEYLGGILEEIVPKEEKRIQRPGRPVTRDTIERLRQIRERIAEENKGEPFEDSTELLRQQREERTRELMGEL